MSKEHKKVIMIRPESIKTDAKNIYKKNGKIGEKFYLQDIAKLQIELVKRSEEHTSELQSH